jgi:hypothetical protein
MLNENIQPPVLECFTQELCYSHTSMRPGMAFYLHRYILIALCDGSVDAMDSLIKSEKCRGILVKC